jgi:hypothetical protein
MHPCNWFPNTCPEMDLILMTLTSKGTLHSVAFGSWRTGGSESHLHSYLGEIFAGDWAMGVNVAICCSGIMLFGSQTVTLLDFFSHTTGSNWTVKHLEIHIMGLDFDIIHWANNYLVNADYWSRLNSDLCYDPTFKDYIQLFSTLQSQSTSPSDLPILPRNMPSYRGPRIKIDPPSLAGGDKEHQKLMAYSPSFSFRNISPCIQPPSSIWKL